MIMWQTNFQQIQQRFTDWWNQRGLVVWMTAERPQMDKLPTPETESLEEMWLSPGFRIATMEYCLSRYEFLAESFPIFDTQIGPGSLGLFLGCGGELAPDTVWYHPVIHDPDSYAPVRFKAQGNLWLERHLRLVDEGVRLNNARWRVGIPDIIENIDTLAALRGDTPLLYDLVERPEWVLEKLAEINQAFFEVYDIFYERLRDEQGSSVFGPFCLWSNGKTAKVQCDLSAAFSARMFGKFVAPYLDEQCRWLDYAMYHLDGTTCLQHLEPLLEIPSIRAIEWTPQAGKPGGGSPEWYELYKRIKAGDKSIQAIGVKVDELIPLLDAIGAQGTYAMLDAPLPLDAAEEMLKALEPYYKN
jgi:hypothetical protein